MYLSFTPTIAIPANTLTVLDTTDTSSVPFYYDLIGAVRIEGPSGLIYNGNLGTPDLNHPGTLSFVQALPAPSGVVPSGLYTVQVTGRYTKRDNLLFVDLGANSVSITAGITDIVAGNTIVLAGGANNGTYTVASVGTNGYGVEVVLVETLASATVSGYLEWTFDEILSTIFDYSITTPVADITQAYDCAGHSFLSTDVTDYNILYTNSTTGVSQTIAPTTTNRTHTVNFPYGPGQVPVDTAVSSSLAAIGITTLWTKTWSTEISTVTTYTLPSGLVVTVTTVGEDEIEVKCDSLLCCIRDCINALNDRYHAALVSNETEAQKLWYKIGDLTGTYISYKSALDCGDNEDVQKYYQRLKDIVANTDCGCGCDDDEVDAYPVEITGLFPIAVNGNTTVVEVSGVYLALVSNTVGGTTTYTLSLVTAQVETLIAAYINANPSLITAIVNTMKLGSSVATFQSTAVDTAVAFGGDCNMGNGVVINLTFGAGLSIADLKQGDAITCGDFPAGTYILAVGATSVTMSNTGLAAVTTSISVGSEAGGIVVQKWKRVVAGVTSYMYQVVGAVQDSIVVDGTTFALKLSGDAAAPGNYKHYGTSALGVKGYQDFATVLAALFATPFNAALPSAFAALFSANFYHTEEYAATVSTVTAATLYTVLTLSNLPAGTYLVIPSMRVDKDTAVNQIITCTIDTTPSAWSMNESIINTDREFVNFSGVHIHTGAGVTTLTMKVSSSQNNGAVAGKATLTAIKIA